MYPFWDYHDFYTPHCGFSCHAQRSHYRCHHALHQCHHYRMECVKIDKNGSNQFKIILDVDNFSAQELKVKAKNQDTIIVEGTRKIDADARINCSLNQFSRTYKVPRHYNAKQAKVVLSADGILMVTIAEGKVDNVEKNLEILESPQDFKNISNDKNDDTTEEDTKEEVVNNEEQVAMEEEAVNEEEAAKEEQVAEE